MEEITVEQVCILAGRIMLKSGAETYRVEDTMNRIAAACGAYDAQSYATPTVVNFSIDWASTTKFSRIEKRATADLDKIAEVNSISRQIADGKLDLEEAYELLLEVDNAPLQYTPLVQTIAAAFVSGGFAVMFGGTWPDFLPAFIAGGFGFLGFLVVDRLLEIRFLAEFFGAFILGVLSYLFISNGFGNALDKVIIGAVMPLVPGLLITNAVRDLIAGHLVAGVSKGVEAVLTAFAIGAGVALIFAFV